MLPVRFPLPHLAIPFFCVGHVSSSQNNRLDTLVTLINVFIDIDHTSFIVYLKFNK
jgi:hypothetical protein